MELTKAEVIKAFEEKDLTAIKIAIAEEEKRRNVQDFSECREVLEEAVIHCIPWFSSTSMGYCGPVVVVVWGIGPEAISSFTVGENGLEHCNSTSW